MKTPEEFVSPSDSRIPKFSKTLPAFLILILAIVIAIIGWRIARYQVETKLQSMFDAEKTLVLNRISSTFNQQGEVLRSIQSLYSRNVQVVRDVFELFATVPKAMYPGIQSISYAPRIAEKNHLSFIEYARNEGYTNYSITPDGIRKEYFPTEYVVPLEGNTSEVGFDLSSDTMRSNAIRQACDNDAVTATALLPSVQNGESILLLIAPIYENGKVKNTVDERRAALQGVCFITLEAKQFIQSAIERAHDSSLVSVEIYDGHEIKKTSLIYKQDTEGTPLKKSEQKFEIAGRHWTILFSTRSDFGKTINTSYPWIVLGGGIIISFLLFGFTFALITSRSHAIDLAERITRSQRRIVDTSQDMISVLSLDGTWKNMNPACKLILGYSPAEMVGRKHEEFIAHTDRDEVLHAILNAKDELPVSFDARYIHKDGSIKWINWSVTSSKRDQRVYLIGRDITEKKKSETEIRLKNRQLDIASMVADRENIKKEASIREQSQEFRTQLTNILGFLDLILTDQNLSRDEELDFLRITDDSAKSLLQSMQQLLEVSYSKTTDTTFNIKPIGVSQIWNDIKQELLKLLPAERMMLSSDDVQTAGLLIQADDQKLRNTIVALLETLHQSYPKIDLGLSLAVSKSLEMCSFDIVMAGVDPELPEFLSLSHKIYDAKLIRDEKSYIMNITRVFIEAMGGALIQEADSNGITFKIQMPLTM